MSEVGDQMIEGMKQTLQDLKDGKPLKTTTVARTKLIKLLQDLGCTVSLSEGKRVVAMGAVKINGVPKTDMAEDVFVRDGDILEVGRKKVEIKLS